MKKNDWYKYYFYICTIFLIICIVYAVKTKIELNEIQQSNINKHNMMMNEHLLSINHYPRQLDGEAILSSEYPIQLFNELIDSLRIAETSAKYTYSSDGFSISNIYSDYSSKIHNFEIEYIRTGTIKDKETFVEIVNELNIITNWLEDRYHNKNYSIYTVEELQKEIGSKLKHVNFDML